MFYDKNFDFLKDRIFWGLFLLITAGVVFVYYRYEFEYDRWRMWKRREHFNEIPAHHLVNRGGVILEKEFVGFEKYHYSQASLDNWHKKVHPEAF